MAVSLPLLLFISAGAFLGPAEAQGLYDDLDNYRRGVDLALMHLNSHTAVQQHFRFFTTMRKASTEGNRVGYFFHHFYLKPTRCAKGTSEQDPQRCPFRNDRPLMDCAVCFKTVDNQIESNPRPYIHCIQKPRLTPAMRISREEHCEKMNYNSGSATLLAITTG